MANDATPESCASWKKTHTHLMTRSQGSSSLLRRTTKTSFGKSRSGFSMLPERLLAQQAKRLARDHG